MLEFLHSHKTKSKNDRSLRQEFHLTVDLRGIYLTNIERMLTAYLLPQSSGGCRNFLNGFAEVGSTIGMIYRCLVYHTVEYYKLRRTLSVSVHTLIHMSWIKRLDLILMETKSR